MRSEPTILTRLTCLMLAVLMTMAMLSGCGAKEEETQPETTQPTVVETLPPEIEYEPSLESGTEAYADIVSIAPAFRIGDSTVQAESEDTGTKSAVDYTDVVCSCVTAKGTTIWVCMTIEAYTASFDSSADFVTGNPKPITFAETLRIRGIVESADALYPGLSAQTGTTVLTGLTMESGKLNAALSRNLTEEAFSAGSAMLAPVWVDIVKLAPAYIIDNTSVDNREVVCECLDVSGNVVWVYMPLISYINHFDSTADLGETDAQNLAVVTLDSPVRVHGAARYAEDLCSGLSESTGVKTMVLMESCEAAPVPETSAPAVEESAEPVVEVEESAVEAEEPAA